MDNRATMEMIEKKDLKQENLMLFWIFSLQVCTYAALVSLVFSKHGSDSWILRVQVFQGFPDRHLIYFWVSIARVVLHEYFVYLMLCYCETWDYTLLKYTRNLIVPLTSLLTAYPCGDNYLLCISFILSAAGGLFFYLALRIPEDLRVTEPLLSLGLAFVLYFRQILMCSIFLVVYFVDSYLLGKVPDDQVSMKLDHVHNTPLLADDVSRDRVVLEGSNHEILLEVRDGRGKLYLRPCGAMFILNNKLSSLVRVIIFGILEQNLAESFGVNVVRDFEFASQDLVLIIQDHHGVLYLASSGIKLNIEGDNLLSLMHFMISLSTSRSLPLLPSTVLTLSYLLTSHGVEAVRLRTLLFVLPLTYIMEKMLGWVDNPMRFHQRAPHFHMEVKGNNLLIYQEEQGGSLTERGADHEEQDGSSIEGGVDLHDQEIV